jgi:hypothetical protein
MGVSRNSYLGPIMVVRFKSIDTKNKRYTCINENCGEYNTKDFKGSDKFCHACGKELGDKEYTSSYIPSISDLAFDEEGEYVDGLDWAEDEFWPAIENETKVKASKGGETKEIKRREIDIYLKQGWSVKKPKYDVERIYPLHIETKRNQRYSLDAYGGVSYVMPGDLEIEVDKAIEEYKERFKVIRKMKGVVNLDINWGLINWYS